MAIKCQLSRCGRQCYLTIRQSCLSDDHQNPKCEEKSNTLILPLLLEDKEHKKEVVTLMEKLISFEKSLDVDVDTGEAEDEEVNDVEKEAAELTHFQKVDVRL